MKMLSGVKVRCDSNKECVEILSILFKNGHTWRGGSVENTLSHYEADELYGLYVRDTEESDFYDQKGAITFGTCQESFWKNNECVLMNIQQIKDYYGEYEQ